jgi:hypothetical protein
MPVQLSESRVLGNKLNLAYCSPLRATELVASKIHGVKLCGNLAIEVAMGWLRLYNHSNPCGIWAAAFYPTPLTITTGPYKNYD